MTNNYNYKDNKSNGPPHIKMIDVSINKRSRRGISGFLRKWFTQCIFFVVEEYLNMWTIVFLKLNVLWKYIFKRTLNILQVFSKVVFYTTNEFSERF